MMPRARSLRAEIKSFLPLCEPEIPRFIPWNWMAVISSASLSRKDTTGGHSPPGMVHTLFFGPAGGRVQNPRSFDRYMISSDGSGLERISYNETFDGFPIFTADGKYLVFCSNRFN